MLRFFLTHQLDLKSGEAIRDLIQACIYFLQNKSAVEASTVLMQSIQSG